MSRILRLVAPVLLACSLAAAAHAKPPAWLTALAARPAAMAYGDAKYAVLLDEADFTLDKNGLVTKRTRYAIRVLTRDGRDAAFAILPYETSSDKVKSFQAWLIPAKNAPVEYGKKHTIDTAVYSNARELYGEARQLVISAYDAATPGDVFAYEAVTTEKSVFTQEVWSFQQAVPVEYSGVTITLPDGWSAQGRTFNRDPVAPTINGRSQTWALSRLPALKEETFGPPRRSLAPWLAIDFTPATGTPTHNRVSFDSWAAVSTYFTQHYENASTPDAVLKSRADLLVAGASTPWERIERLCRFAQSVNYISINLNAATAGGMIPRPASRVLQCNYGDCKDKVTLLRALLRSQNLSSYPVIVYSGDSTHVRPEWVSPAQFNHCIIAIPVDDSAVDQPGILVHPTLGRLLIFDPTNETTPPGWLASENLSGHALVLAGPQGELIQLPSASTEHSRVERVISARLDLLGGIAGTITENFHGYAAISVRDERKPLSASDYRTKVIEPWLARTLPSARVTQLDATDDLAASHLNLTIGFEARAYGKTMRDTLLVFKPVIVARREHISLKKGERTQPVLINGRTFSERTEIELPEGFAVDENFSPVSLQCPFGEYTASCELQDNRLIFKRQLFLRPTTLPASEYEVARAFFERLFQAEQSPVVLRRL